MIEEPGSFSGIDSSPRPDRGPEASQRMSLEIFISEAAKVSSAPWAKTISSCADSAANLLGCERKGRPVSWAIFWPLVPQIQDAHSAQCRPRSRQWRNRRDRRAYSRRLMSRSSRDAQPPNSCPKVKGTASCRWVRPILTMSLNCRALAAIASWTFLTAGIRRSSPAPPLRCASRRERCRWTIATC